MAATAVQPAPADPASTSVLPLADPSNAPPPLTADPTTDAPPVVVVAHDSSNSPPPLTADPVTDAPPVVVVAHGSPSSARRPSSPRGSPEKKRPKLAGESSGSLDNGDSTSAAASVPMKPGSAVCPNCGSLLLVYTKLKPITL